MSAALETTPIFETPYWQGLTISPSSRDVILRMLANETDMAFRRRALVLLSYLALHDSDQVLECGCGRGFYLNMIRAVSNCRLVGVELDPEPLEIAHRQLSSRNVHVSRADITRLPFPSDHFDKILFTEVLEHIPDDKGALREIFRVLKKGGTLALTVPNARYPLLWDPINRVLENLGLPPIRKGILAGIWANHERLYTIEELQRLTQEAGFEIIDRRFVTRYCFPFSHNIVYGIGKELLVRGLLPDSLAKASDRFTYDENRGSMMNPVNLMRAVFRRVDRLNDYRREEGSSVLLALKLRKP